ncbi:hypothetical protein N7508_008443 [Penicillium antarcticum]|uniref:uncharacterized protein n=1 Tax=Penicillium antarcticum TaxID=416450 RepID=UPI0023A6991E|nr:uncharacterized protein N7508_008443 [Penicillium antarcticum]KAJ5293622.1 hypothetical protein N7508_008443 [Penicillium antarcticum]
MSDSKQIIFNKSVQLNGSPESIKFFTNEDWKSAGSREQPHDPTLFIQGEKSTTFIMGQEGYLYNLSNNLSYERLRPEPKSTPRSGNR